MRCSVFGKGRIKKFNPNTNIYQVELCFGGTGFLNSSFLSGFVASGCEVGCDVVLDARRLGGLTGRLVEVQAATGVHVVETATAGMKMFLQPEMISNRIEACVGGERAL